MLTPSHLPYICLQNGLALEWTVLGRGANIERMHPGPGTLHPRLPLPSLRPRLHLPRLQISLLNIQMENSLTALSVTPPPTDPSTQQSPHATMPTTPSLTQAEPSDYVSTQSPSTMTPRSDAAMLLSQPLGQNPQIAINTNAVSLTPANPTAETSPAISLIPANPAV